MKVLKFSKEKWLASANEQVEAKVLSEREVEDAYNGWVSDLDGKTEQELTAMNANIRSEWLV
jgi:hypothetical protein